MIWFDTMAEAVNVLDEHFHNTCNPHWLGHVEVRRGKDFLRAERDRDISACTLERMQERENFVSRLSGNPKKVNLEDVEIARARIMAEYAPLIEAAPERDEFGVRLEVVEDEVLEPAFPDDMTFLGRE